MVSYNDVIAGFTAQSIIAFATKNLIEPLASGNRVISVSTKNYDSGTGSRGIYHIIIITRVGEISCQYSGISSYSCISATILASITINNQR